MQWLNLEDNVNLLALIGSLVLIVITMGVVGKYFKNMKDAKDTNVKLSEDEWDGIRDYHNGLPIGWAIMFLLVLIWAIWYFLIGYPLNSYSQIGEYNNEVKTFNEKFQKKYKNPTHEELMEMGSSVFSVKCSVCHGITGNGMGNKATNLQIWGSEDGIYNAIVNGSKGLGFPGGEMPGGLAGNDENAKAIAAYVAKDLSAIKTTKNEDLVAKGKELYDVSCMACHGTDGKGMDGVFPDLTIYGSSDFVVDVLNRGKNGDIGVMPKFDHNLLNSVQQRGVGEYVISLSRDK